MALPVTNNNNAAPLAANQAFLALYPPGFIPGASSSAMFNSVGYVLLAGSTGVGTILTFQTLCLDGVWRNIAAPAPITAANNTSYNGSIAGPIGPVQVVVSGLVGNGFAYGQLSGILPGGA